MRLWPCLVASAFALLATSARADAQSDADALIDHGVQLREQGKDDLALEEFQKANALAPSPRAAAQVGLAEQALGIWRDAERDLGDALKTSGDPWIEKNRAALEAAKDTIQMHLGSLEIRCDAPDAEVFVDGAARGKIAPGQPIRVESGTRNVQVRAPGRQPTSRSVMVPAGGIARETIALEPLATPAEPPHSESKREAAKSATSDDSQGEPIGATQRNVGWALLGTSAALVVTGFAGIGARSLEVSSYNDDGSCPGLAATDQPAGCQSKIDTAQTWTTVSIVGFVGAGVLATGGTILLLTAPHSGRRGGGNSGKTPANRSGPSSSPATARPSVTCGAALGIYCAGRF